MGNDELCMPSGAAHVRIIVVSDIRLYRDGLAQVISRLPDLEVVATCESALECLAVARQDIPDVILLDMSSPTSAAAARLFTQEFSSVRIVALAVPETVGHVLACVEAGVTGYVPREGSIDDLVAAIRHAARGEAICSPMITAGLMRRVAALAEDTSHDCHLTAREHEIAEHIALGLTNRGIAARLGIELCTVKNHVHNILEKLGVTGRSEIADYLRGGTSAQPDTTGVRTWIRPDSDRGIECVSPVQAATSLT